MPPPTEATTTASQVGTSPQLMPLTARTLQRGGICGPEVAGQNQAPDRRLQELNSHSQFGKSVSLVAPDLPMLSPALTGLIFRR